MLRFDNCPNCFSPLDGKATCGHCGYCYETDRKQPKGAIQPFSVIGDRYLVGRVLGKGGFGITYIAKDVINNTLYAIKEYMPTEYSERDADSDNIYPKNDRKSNYVFSHGREKFLEEARTLHKLRSNPIVVNIVDYFNQNNTAYLAMEYLDGCDLRVYKAKQGGRVDADYAKIIFVTVASALMEIHRMNILHRDLSPENIFLTTDGNIKLIDFGAARNYVSSQNKGMSILLKHGFAPPEQYTTDGTQGPWSDVYALCATFYNVVSGKGVKDAIMRYRGERLETLKELGCNVSETTSRVIDKGLSLDYKQRYQDFGSLLNDLDIQAGNESQRKQILKEKIDQKEQAERERTEHERAERERTEHERAERERAERERIERKQIEKTKRDSQEEKRATKESVTSKKPRAYLGVISGNQVIKTLPLAPDIEFKIGRSQSCDYIVSGDTNISRVHCIVKYSSSDHKFIICDSSSNGTYFADGFRLQKGILYAIRARYPFYIISPKHRFVFLEAT